jgi:hypothetical protein
MKLNLMDAVLARSRALRAPPSFRSKVFGGGVVPRRIDADT